MKWSVVVQAGGDRVVSREEVVGLADAVASYNGVASGIGTTAYAAQIEVEAESADDARELAATEFTRAASEAGLPPWPVSVVDLVSEADDELGHLE